MKRESQLLFYFFKQAAFLISWPFFLMYQQEPRRDQRQEVAISENSKQYGSSYSYRKKKIGCEHHLSLHLKWYPGVLIGQKILQTNTLINLAFILVTEPRDSYEFTEFGKHHIIQYYSKNLKNYGLVLIWQDN